MSTVLLAGTLVMGCSGGSDEASTPSSTTSSPSSAGGDEGELTEGAVAYLLDHLGEIDAASLMIVDYIGRAYDRPELEAAHRQAVARLGSTELSDDEAALRRLVEPDAPASGVELDEPTTTVLAAALHCDQVAFEADDMAGLKDLVAAGGYGTTHAALAVGWLGELGCTPDGLDRTRADTIERIAEELSAVAEVSDLAVEQSATLHYLDAADRVPTTWAPEVAAAVGDDGGWGPSRSNWHMTMLALWTLLAEEGPATGAPMLRAAA